MSTLSNVTPAGQEAKTSCVGFASDALSVSITDGVSVRFAPNPNRQWFVLRVTYNRITQAVKLFDTSKAEIYFPLHYTLKAINGKKKRVKEPLLPNILFAYTTADYIDKLVKDCESEAKAEEKKNKLISYYYNHFSVNAENKNLPLTIGFEDMMNFIRATCTGNEHVKVVTPEQCHYKSGDYVEITEGEFIGIKGRVARVSGQQRVIVEVEGLCMIATAYIPSAFLKILDAKV